MKSEWKTPRPMECVAYDLEGWTHGLQGRRKPASHARQDVARRMSSRDVEHFPQCLRDIVQSNKVRDLTVGQTCYTINCYIRQAKPVTIIQGQRGVGFCICSLTTTTNQLHHDKGEVV
jgi:hypothetical protein